MNPIGLLILGAAYGFLAGNPKARTQTSSALQKIAGMAIDALTNKGGAVDASTSDTLSETEQQ